MSIEDQKRRDPDDLLKRINEEDNKKKRGYLKIFFGMAAGSGKTYAMLQAAHRGLTGGSDIVAAYIESHGREDIEKILLSIPSLPRKKINYRGVDIEEMDIDAALERRPGIALVDELAHTNAPGSRHQKRFHDVFELLDAGINVYTTLNVQHLESRAETVREITGVTIQETIPDSVLDRADEIELIDISPDELRKRLHEGKIYPRERAEIASENFFEFGNLTALREMALRLTAEKVDHSLQDYRQAKQILEPWKTGERLLVAVSHSPYSESLIRWTRRMAYNLDAPWIAVYVETSKSLSTKDQQCLQKNLSLARELGAEIILTRDEDVTRGLLRIARQRNITQIVAGKPGGGFWKEFFRIRQPIKHLIKESGNIDLYIIRADRNGPGQAERRLVFFSGTNKWSHYFYLFIVLILVITINYAIYPFIGARSVSFIFLLSVLILAQFTGRIPIFIYAALSAFSWNFLFLQPQFTLYIYHIDDAIMFLMYFFIAIVAGSMTTRIRTHEISALKREEQLNVLYEMTKKFTSAKGIDEAAGHVLSYINATFGAESVMFLKSEQGLLNRNPYLPGGVIVTDKEFAIASFSFSNNRSAGRFTDTLSESVYLFIPLYFKKENVVGVLGVKFPEKTVLAMEQKTMIETLAGHLALVIERDLFMQKVQNAKISEESEKLFKVIIDSISHELRTPLTAIKGSIGMLMNREVAENQQSTDHLLNDTQGAVERLIGMVDNLLDINRIESGKLKLNLDWNDLSDIVNTTLNRLEMGMDNHIITVKIPDDMPLIRVDYNLISLALYCILHNALVHTKSNTDITLKALSMKKGISITIEDKGPGLKGDINRVFDKFYRSRNGGSYAGLGLGLSISKGIIDLHGGRITAENKSPSGARFILELPVESKERSDIIKL